MNWFQKIRDNLIPIEKLYNKFFYTDKVASLLLKLPYQELNQETALVHLLNKGFSKYELLRLYNRQLKYEIYINKAMNKFIVYDPSIRKHVQLVRVQYGQGIEYLLLGEILERDYGFKFKYTPQQISQDNGKSLCMEIEQVMNRISDYFRSKDTRILKSIQEMLEQERLLKQLEDAE